MEKRAENVQKFINEIHEDIDMSINEYLSKCESPIEELFCVGLMKELGLVGGSEPMQSYDDEVSIYPQYEVDITNTKKYRVDFLLCMTGMVFVHGIPFTDWETELAVECDGWEFHSTKEQIENDNNRDAEILAVRDIPTIRFLGKDIAADPRKCAKKAIGTIRRMHELKSKEVNQIADWTANYVIKNVMRAKGEVSDE